MLKNVNPRAITLFFSSRRLLHIKEGPCKFQVTCAMKALRGSLVALERLHAFSFEPAGTLPPPPSLSTWVYSVRLSYPPISRATGLRLVKQVLYFKVQSLPNLSREEMGLPLLPCLLLTSLLAHIPSLKVSCSSGSYSEAPVTPLSAETTYALSTADELSSS